MFMKCCDDSDKHFLQYFVILSLLAFERIRVYCSLYLLLFITPLLAGFHASS